jgi:O-antigen biosynthesis protein
LDNTARYRNRALIYHGGNPQRFEYWLRQLAAKLTKHNRPEERLLFINAWNEWAEGAHLEPDSQHQFGYLEAVRNMLRT